jgi:hypothetical protein
MPSSFPERSASRGEALSWITSGVMASACVLWLTFARAEQVAAIALNLGPGQPIHGVDFSWRRVLAVRGAGVAMAVALTLGGIVLRKQPLDGRSLGAWLHLLAGLGTVLAVMLIAREMRGRPVTADMWFVYAGVTSGLVTAFWRARRRSAPHIITG